MTSVYASFYQEYLSKDLTEKYGALNAEMEKVIHEANTEISSLQNRLSGLYLYPTYIFLRITCLTTEKRCSWIRSNSTRRTRNSLPCTERSARSIRKWQISITCWRVAPWGLRCRPPHQTLSPTPWIPSQELETRTWFLWTMGGQYISHVRCRLLLVTSVLIKRISMASSNCTDTREVAAGVLGVVVDWPIRQQWHLQNGHLLPVSRFFLCLKEGRITYNGKYVLIKY